MKKLGMLLAISMIATAAVAQRFDPPPPDVTWPHELTWPPGPGAMMPIPPMPNDPHQRCADYWSDREQRKIRICERRDTNRDPGN